MSPRPKQQSGIATDISSVRQFWKEFFEASANVSLSGYEEQPLDDTNVEETTTTEDSTAITHSTLDETATYDEHSTEHAEEGEAQHHSGDDDIDLSSMSLSPSHSTPRPTRRTHDADADSTSNTGSFIDYPSPYEALRREVAGDTTAKPYTEPTTPGKAPSGFRHTRQMASAQTPGSSPYKPPQATSTTTNPASTARKTRTGSTSDPLLHRVLDKTYRIQATPLKGPDQYGAGRNRFATPGTAQKTTRRLFDSSPMSSPEIEAPKLNAELFSSPVRGGGIPSSARKPRTPGVSVLTPAGKGKGGYQPSSINASKQKQPVWDSDDDDDLPDDENADPYNRFGSPPKTMHFHIPQSRLLQTPAKEATKRIVDDLLLNAGGGDFTEEDIDLSIPHDAGEMGFGEGEGEEFELTLDGEGMEEYHRGVDLESPSLVRRAEGLDDITF